LSCIDPKYTDNMKKVLLFLTLLVVSTGGLLAAWLENVPLQLTQPNGEELNVFITGDEFFRRVHDSEGYTIVQRADGWYVYADYDAGKDELVPTEYIVSPPTPPTGGVQSAPNGEAADSSTSVGMTRGDRGSLRPGLGISLKKYMEKRRSYYEFTGRNLSGARKEDTSVPEGGGTQSPLQRAGEAAAAAPKKINNIVICIGFSDTEEMTHPYPMVNGMLNTDADNNLRDFYQKASYEKIDLVSHIYPRTTNDTTLRFYRSPNPRSDYSGSYTDAEQALKEHALLRDAINWINEHDPIQLNGNELDGDSDGLCDYITFVIYGPPGGWSDLLWPHQWALTFAYNTDNNRPKVYLKGKDGVEKRVWSYNFMLDGNTTYFNVGVFAHEGFHQLGAPDLYHYDAGSSLKAVGGWDLMDVNGRPKPQMPAAWLKYRYGGWVTPTQGVLNSKHTVYPSYTNDGSDPKKPVLIRIPSSQPNQSYVVEYRKKTGNNYDDQNVVPGEGLLIYRIDERFRGNANYDPSAILPVYDEVYLYRRGSGPSGNSYTEGTLSQAPFTDTRTAFHATSTPRAFLNASSPTYDYGMSISDITYDEATDSYSFFYGRAASIEQLITSTGVVTPDFASTIFEYTVTLPCGVSTFTVTATPGGTSSSVTYLMYGNQATQPLDVSSPDVTPLVIRATSSANDRRDYMLTIVRPFEPTILRPYWNDVLAVNLNNGSYTFSGFQWYKNGEKMQGATLPYLYLSSGMSTNNNYSVALTTSAGKTIPTCPVTPSLAPAASAPEQALKVYPNPAKEFITVENLKWLDIDFVELYDMNGRCVQRVRSNAPILQMDVASVPSGVYVLRAGNETVKIVVSD